MFGIKSFVEHFITAWDSATDTKITNDVAIRKLMVAFVADEYGHQANTKQADLGYGWFHYGVIRMFKPKKLLCVGSRYGYIPAVMAQACKDNGFGHVYFVDAGYDEDEKNSYTGKGYWKTEEGKNCFSRFQLDSYITLFVMKSGEFKKRYPKEMLDYIYIDGDHSYQGVKNDEKLFWPMLTDHGFMCFHDICVKEKMPEGEYGVNKFWNERVKGKATTIESPFLGSGLGVLQKRK